jgi:hypothetical protein
MTTLSRRLSFLQGPKTPGSRLIPFGEWLPDLPEHANPGVLAATNVIPALNSYRPFPGLSAQSTNALDALALGAFSATDASNNVYVYAGNASKLYELVDLAWTDESKAGGYSTATDDVWEFALFGNSVIATNFTDNVQSMAIGGGAAGAFADLMTSTLKPKAKHLDTLRQFLVLGNTNDTTDGHVPNRVWWSAIRDAADFDPDATTQSDYEDLRQGGWVQRIIGGAEYGLVYQERQITRMEYQGFPSVFGFYPIVRDRGTPIPNSVVGYGRDAFFISEIGFERFTGMGSVPIGVNKVDRTFWNQFDIGNKRYMSAAIDPLNKLVCWLFPGEGASGFIPNKIFLYNWAVDRWSEIDVTGITIVMRTKTQGFTLDSLDAVVPDIDAAGVESFDSDVWKGGKLRFAAFDQNNKLAYFIGPNAKVIIETGEMQLTPGRRSHVVSLKPMAEGAGLSGPATNVPLDLPSNISPTALRLEIGGRSRPMDTVTFDSVSPSGPYGVSINASGECPVNNDNRYHRVRMEIDPGTEWEHAYGAQATFSSTGKK